MEFPSGIVADKKTAWRRYKNGGAYLCESKLILCFCNSLIAKHSHGDTGIKAKNRVLKQAKMVSIYQKTISGTPKKSRNQQFRVSQKSLPFIKKNSLTQHMNRILIRSADHRKVMI